MEIVGEIRDIIEDAQRRLNEAAEEGTAWHVSVVGLSQKSNEEGRLALVSLWCLSDQHDVELPE